MAKFKEAGHNPGAHSVFVSSDAFWELVERCALAASGFAIFGPAIALQAIAPLAAWPDRVALITSIVLWGAAFGLRRGALRHLLQVSAGLALLIWPWFLPGPAEWIQPAIIGCGVMSGAVFTLRWLPSLLVVTAAGTLSAALSITLPPSVVFAEGDIKDRLLGPVLATLVNLGFIVSVAAWRQLTARIDHEEREIRRELQARVAAEEMHRSQDSVARRIHETVLNSLTAISLGVPEESTDKVRRSCHQDLEAMESGLAVMDRTDAAAIVNAAASGVAIQTTICDDLGEQVTLSLAASRALRDAVVEALRNTERHSGASEAQISMSRMGDVLDVSVSDEGRGIAPGTPEGIGIARAIRGSVESVGGRVSIDSHPGHTRVLLTLPISDATPELELRLRDFTQSDLPGRLGLLGAACFVALTITPILGTSAATLITSVLAVCFIAVSVVLALAWMTRWRTMLSVLGVSLVILTLLSLSTAAQDCVVVPLVSKQMLALAGAGSVIFVLAQRRALTMGGMITAIALAGIILTAQIPLACRGLPITNLPIGLGYLVAVAVGGALANGMLERRRLKAMADWNELARTRARALAMESAQSMWKIVDERTKTFLAEIASGSRDPRSATAQLESTILAAGVRNALAHQPQISNPGARLLNSLFEVAAAAGARVDLEVARPWQRTEHYPDEVAEYCRSALAGISFTDMRVSVTVDEDDELLAILLTGETAALGMIRSVGEFGDCEVTLDTDEVEPDLVFMGVRRPTSPHDHALTG